MASTFEVNTLAEIAVLNVMIDRILCRLANAAPDPHSFLAAELELGSERLATANDWSVSQTTQEEILSIAQARYSDRIRDIQARVAAV